MSNQNKTLDAIIKKFQLGGHIEGGYYKRNYESSDIIDSQRHGGRRKAGTAIYYLLTNNEFSSWHRLKSDEIWHFYYGSDVTIYILHSNGDIENKLLGNAIENENAQFQIVVPYGKWFAAVTNAQNAFSLVGCTVCPGFEKNDLELASYNELLKIYPQYSDLIIKLSKNKNNINA